MKIHFNFIFLILIFTCCNSEKNLQPNKTDIEKNNLKGKVKSLKIYAEQNCEDASDSLFYKEIIFDKNGFISTEIFVNPKTRKNSKNICLRDELGYLKLVSSINHDGDVIKTETYQYKDNLIKKLSIKSEYTLKEVKYEYFDNDSIKKIENFIDGKRTNYMLCEYDTASNKAIQRIYNNQNRLGIEYISILDEQRKMLTSQTLMYDEFITSKHPFVTITYQYFFDQNNNIKLQLRFDNSKLKSQVSYEYEFDQLKNWTLQKVFRDDTLAYCVKREIEYYE